MPIDPGMVVPEAPNDWNWMWMAKGAQRRQELVCNDPVALHVDPYQVKAEVGHCPDSAKARE